MTSTPETDSSEPWTDMAWLQEVLRDLEGDPSLSIIDQHVKDSSSIGDHYLSDMHRINVKLQRAGNERSEMFLIAKTLPAGKEMQKTLSKSAAFPNEVNVFKQILPQYQTILDTASPGSFKPFAARHICSQNKLPYFLVVSDLAPEGFRMASRQKGLDIDHCLLVMKTLGRYHAASVALHERYPEFVESFQDNLFTEESSVEWVQKISQAAGSSVAKMVQTWSDVGEDVADRLRNAYKTFPQQLQQLYLPQGNRLNVLLHGDAWFNNFLFKYNDFTGKVEDMRMVDFQQTSYSSFAVDLQYFMHTSPNEEVRVSHTQELFKEYHSELCSTLKLLGLPEKAISFQELLEEYEKKGALGFIMSVCFLPAMMADPENAADMDALLSGNYQTTRPETRSNNKEYIKIMKRILPVFQQKGYF